MSFADILKDNSEDIWKKILKHIFIHEISNDVLPNEKFIFYLLQDKIFLKEFCIFLDKAMKISMDENIKKWINELIYSTVNHEMKMQNDLLEMLRYTNNTKTTIQANEITLNYIFDMKKLLQDTSKLYEVISFMAPCPWTYFEIAEKIKNENRIKNEVSKKWLKFYSSDESKQQVEFLKELLNELSKELTVTDKTKMKNLFNKACQNELDFWKMSYYTVN
ncbi:MAG: hypothetical protein H0X03_02670 [Nitrosopumilus sp.]|nr:hypothetical protein [Nitrosopumilus sp.]